MSDQKTKDLRKLLFPKFEKDSNLNFPVTDVVRKLERKNQLLNDLLGEIITTFRLDGNQKYFDENMPDNWHEITSNWIKRYDHLKEKPDQTT